MDKHDKYEAVKQAWFEINEHLRNNKQDYIEYLKFSSKMYKQPYSDAVLVFQQDRNATKIAEYKKWGRLGRYVRRGSHGVAVFGKNHTCRYLYDVTQTGGKELPEMWTLTDRNTPELLNTLNNRYNINAGSVKECIETMTANSIILRLLLSQYKMQYLKWDLTQNRLRYTAIHWILWCSSLFLKDVIFQVK